MSERKILGAALVLALAGALLAGRLPAQSLDREGAEAPAPSTPPRTTERPADPPRRFLTTVAALQRQSPAEANLAKPVHLEAVVTFVHGPWRLLYVQDSTGGIYCDPGPLQVLPPLGHKVEIIGVTRSGAFQPVVHVQSLRVLAAASLPEPQPVTAGELWEGKFDGHLVQLAGFVTTVEPWLAAEPILKIHLLSDGQPIEVTVPGPLPGADGLNGARVTITGVLGLRADSHRRITKVGILVPRTDLFRVEQDAPSVLAALPDIPLREVIGMTNRLVRTRGIVHLGATRRFWLCDSNNGIYVISVAPAGVFPGEQVEVAGLIRSVLGEPQMQLYRVISRGPGEPLIPQPIPAARLFEPGRHGQLVKVTGDYLHGIVREDGDLLVLRDGERAFEGKVFPKQVSPRDRLSPGSRIEFSGILCAAATQAGTAPRILITHSEDLRVLTPPPWPMSRTLGVVTTLAALLAGGLIALTFAYHRVRVSSLRAAHADRELRALNSELDARIKARTGELESVNRQLHQEVVERRQRETALRESEERFAKAFTNSPAVSTINTYPEGAYLDANDEFSNVLGYSREEIIGKSAVSLGIWADPEQQAELIQTLGAGRPVRGVEIAVRARSGQIYTLLGSLVRVDIGQRPCTLTIAYDITRRKRTELERARLEIQLRQAQKMEAIGTLAGGIAHDFNNILGSIIGYTEFARRDLRNNPDVAESLALVLKASHRAKELVRQILTFSRQEGVERTALRLDTVLADTVNLVRTTLPDTLELCTAVISPVPAILGNETLLQQALVNLVNNAAQAIGKHPGRIEIELHGHVARSTALVPPGLKPGRHARIVVRDNGPGIEPAIFDRIFEPFYTTKGPGEGTGLGLSVVHGIVQSHGGTIRVESQPGAGATFEIYLPSEPEGAPPSLETLVRSPD